MNKKNNFINDEVPAHKKRSKKKGLSRADHKHIYETVLLTRHYHFNFGDSEDIKPAKVCTICGRIDKVDHDESLWKKHLDTSIKPLAIWTKDLSEKALSLPKWYANNFDKFAIKTEEAEKNDISISD